MNPPGYHFVSLGLISPRMIPDSGEVAPSPIFGDECSTSPTATESQMHSNSHQPLTSTSIPSPVDRTKSSPMSQSMQTRSNLYLDLVLNPPPNSTQFPPTPSPTTSAGFLYRGAFPVPALSSALQHLYSFSNMAATHQILPTENHAAAGSHKDMGPAAAGTPVSTGDSIFKLGIPTPDLTPVSSFITPSETGTTSLPPRKKYKAIQTGDTVANPWLCYLCFRRLVGKSSAQRHMIEVHGLDKRDVDISRIKTMKETLRSGEIPADVEEIAWGCVDIGQSNYWGVKDEKTGTAMRGRARFGRDAAVRYANAELEVWKWKLDLEALSPGRHEASAYETVLDAAKYYGVGELQDIDAIMSESPKASTKKQTRLGLRSGALAVIAQAALEIGETLEMGLRRGETENDWRDKMERRQVMNGKKEEVKKETAAERGADRGSSDLVRVKHRSMTQSVLKPNLPANTEKSV